MIRLHVHVVSDSTGETVTTVGRAVLSQFEDVMAVEHVWSFVRSDQQIETVLQEIEALPGAVLFTLVSAEHRRRLEDGCARLGVPCVAILDQAMHVLQGVLGLTLRPVVGGQHALDAEYFARIEAMNFMLRHDDGLFHDELDREADVVLVGVSRTSKTPTCLYLANRGVKAANVPIVPERPLPDSLGRLQRPLVVGLSINPEQLVQIRESRLRQLGGEGHPRIASDYAEIARIKEELVVARRLFARHGWPVIDVTRRSVEETAAGVLQLLRARRESSEAGASRLS